MPARGQAWRYALVSAASLGLNTAGEYLFHDVLGIAVPAGARHHVRDREQRLELPDAAISSYSRRAPSAAGTPP